MTLEQRELSFKLAVGLGGKPGITPEDFAQSFPDAIEDGKLSTGILQDAVESQNPDDLEAILIVGFTFGLTQEHVPILAQVLREDWHRSHEDIVMAFQSMRSPEAIDCLRDVIFVSHHYLNYDDSFGFARKCTWALADIGTPKAKRVLEEVSESENSIIADYARKRLNCWLEESHRKGPNK